MRFGAIDLYRQIKFLSHLSHICEALFIVRAASSYIYLDVCLFERVRILFDSVNYSREGLGNIRKICYAASYYQEFGFSLTVFFLRHKLQYGFCVSIGEFSRGITAVLAVVCKFSRESEVRHRVGKYNTGAASGDKCPDTSLGIENR